VEANSCDSDFRTLHEFLQSLQCVWVCCKGSLFGLVHDAMPGAAHIQPQSKTFPHVQVTDSLLALTDKLSCASQMAPPFLLRDDLSAKVGGLNEVAHSHRTFPVAHTALLQACRCKCQSINAAGRLLVDLASSLNGVLCTGRVCGDNGQASFVRLPGQEVAGWPNLVLMSSAFFWLAACSPVRRISDQCTMSLHFVVEDAGVLADWFLSARHNCAFEGCGELFALCCRLDRAATFVAALQANSGHQGQLERAMLRDLEKACCLQRSVVVHAVEDPGIVR